MEHTLIFPPLSRQRKVNHSQKKVIRSDHSPVSLSSRPNLWAFAREEEMGDYVPLSPVPEEAEPSRKEGRRAGGTRVASLDVFRGLSIAVSSLLASLTPRFQSLVS